MTTLFRSQIAILSTLVIVTFVQGQTRYPELRQIDKDLMRAAMFGPTKETIALVVNEKTRKIEEKKEPAFTKTVSDCIKQGANINCQYQNGRTPLMMAVQFNNCGAAEILIDSGAHVDLVDVQGKTALMVACGLGFDNLRIIKKLIEYGANVNHQDKDGMFPLMAVVGTSRESLVEYLVNSGALINMKTTDGYTALTLAKKYRLNTMVTLLKKLGAKSELK